jgi:hypothetical protein
MSGLLNRRRISRGVMSFKKKNFMKIILLIDAEFTGKIRQEICQKSIKLDNITIMGTILKTCDFDRRFNKIDNYLDTDSHRFTRI